MLFWENHLKIASMFKKSYRDYDSFCTTRYILPKGQHCRAHRMKILGVSQTNIILSKFDHWPLCRTCKKIITIVKHKIWQFYNLWYCSVLLSASEITDFCAKLFVNPTRGSKGIERTGKCDRQTDGRTDGRTGRSTDRRTDGQTTELKTICLPISWGET